MGISVKLNDEKQTIHSFGASDCWTTKFFGKWSNTGKKNQIADYLFSMDTDADGNPKGIGLSLWRFNIGAGTFEQGTASGIATDWRREECFQNPDGTYDWNKHQGQQWFVQAARQRGVPYLLGFSVHPPVHMTITGNGNSRKRTDLNLKADQYEAFADFLANVARRFKDAGTPMHYISPFNEPQYDWGETSGNASQEGTAATNAQIAQVVKLLGPKLAAKGVETQIAVGEAAQWKYLTKGSSNRENQLADWFTPSSANYIGNVPNLAPLASVHSYFSTCPSSTLISERQEALARRNSVNPALQLWQTEFGILGDICGQYNGSPRNTGIDHGLYVAKVIHHDLVLADVSSWQWWLAVSPYNYSDALVYINDPSGAINVDGTKNDGMVLDSKQLWCMGNFSRFIRPGMKRVEASLEGITTPAQAADSYMISAYKDPASKDLVIVLVNPTTASRTLNLNALTGGQLASNALTAYTTSATMSLKKSVMPADKIPLEAKSVITLVGKYQ